MTRIALAAAAAASLAFAAAAQASTPVVLKGEVGPGFTIKLTQNGTKVSELKAGKYLLVINDRASIHSFELKQQSGGQLAKELASVSFTGTNIYTVTLAKGKYKYFCKPHESSMFGFFTVS